MTEAPGPEPRRRGGRFVGLAATFALSAAAFYYYPQLAALVKDEPPPKPTRVASAAPQKVEVEFERKPKQPVLAKTDGRDPASSPALQVKKSWESPGVYVWGSNSGLVADPSSPADKVVKTPRRIAYFDGQLLRDLKLARDFGVAVTEKGDLVQWGRGFSKAELPPTPTLTGRDIVKVDVSADRVVALSSNGTVYCLPASKDDQEIGAKAAAAPAPGAGSWLPFWSRDGLAAP